MTLKQRVKALREDIDKGYNLESKLDDLAQGFWEEFNQLGEKAQEGPKGQRLQLQAETCEEAITHVMELLDRLEEVFNA